MKAVILTGFFLLVLYMPNYVTLSLEKAQVGKDKGRSKIPETSDKWKLVDR